MQQNALNFGLGIILGMKQTPLWLNGVVAVTQETAASIARHKQPTMLPETMRAERTAEDVLRDALILMLGWWLGKQLR